MLIVWLIFLEMNNKKKTLSVGFGVTSSELKEGFSESHDNGNFFNFPR
jgi:hypothetical protein